MKNKKQLTTQVTIIIIVAVISFFVGTKYQQSKLTSRFSQRSNNFSREGMIPQDGTSRGNRSPQDNNNHNQPPGFPQTVGKIINIDENSITIKTNDGGSKIILISESTVINQSIEVSKTNLKVGSSVHVSGSVNSDGSISGRQIEVGPESVTILENTKE